ncbi:paraquat-inducible protein A [Shewanella olleyana]|uniref:paraquat-inducible protein A n=1 Tax=Shewanella olleyana TaxID=135626 RepID=UPI00200FFA03|nr:paraquat-inducible protein A [Shewanella olleyana]MCL1066966.1 paraquat-inducible protein A [Shewanella olleyana]
MPKNLDQDTIILCRSCDLAVQRRALPSNVRALCPRCHTALYDVPYCSINGMLALCIAALLFFIPANLLPVLEIHFMGSIRATTVYETAVAVWNHDYWIVAIAVIASAVLAPGLLILSILFQIIIVKLKLQSTFWQKTYKRLLKNHELLSQLSMLEIYVISFLVAAFNLSDFAEIYLGMGTLSFGILFLVILFLQREYNLEHMWGMVHDK